MAESDSIRAKVYVATVFMMARFDMIEWRNSCIKPIDLVEYT
jgi:hypothetical protein